MITEPYMISCSIENDPVETFQSELFRTFKPGPIVNYQFNFSDGNFLKYNVEKDVTPAVVSWIVKVVAESFCKNQSPWTLAQVQMLVDKAIEVEPKK